MIARYRGGGSGGLGKVTSPSANRVHAKERLFARLDAGFARPVVWVQGQPGAGKTTLVTSYLAARKIATTTGRGTWRWVSNTGAYKGAKGGGAYSWSMTSPTEVAGEWHEEAFAARN